MAQESKHAGHEDVTVTKGKDREREQREQREHREREKEKDKEAESKASQPAQQPVMELSPIEEMERMFERLMPRGWLRSRRRNWRGDRESTRTPAVDVIDRDFDVVVRIEMPGVEKRDISVVTTENTLTASGETQYERFEEEGDYYRCEISQRSFKRTVQLPCQIDPDEATATFKDGILEVVLAKVNGAKRHRVEVE